MTLLSQAECRYLTVKSLRIIGLPDFNTKNIRLGFIFTHTGGLYDDFYCEDKEFKTTSIESLGLPITL